MNGFFLVLLLLICMKISFSQKDTIQFKKNAVYGELLGNAGVLYSLNYERILLKHKNGFFTGRIGVGNLFLVDYDEFDIPILINHVLSIEEHHFEVGGGLISGIGQNLKTKKIKFLMNIGATVNLMYRYQKPGGRFVFRVGWTPGYYFEKDPDPLIVFFFLLMPGASIGYAF